MTGIGCVTMHSEGSKPELLIQYDLLENECGKMLHTASEINLDWTGLSYNVSWVPHNLSIRGRKDEEKLDAKFFIQAFHSYSMGYTSQKTSALFQLSLINLAGRK